MADSGVSQPPVVITGATGFIGRRLQSLLIQRGHALRLLIRPESGHHDRVVSEAQVISVSLDQDGASPPSDNSLLVAVVKDCAAVIYCAGTVRGRALPDFEAANVKGLRALLEALSQLGTAPPLLLISSLAASRPELSDYAQSKYLGERVLQDFPQLPWSIIRPPAVYGPGERELRPLFNLARRGLLPRLGPAEQRFSLLHVDDLTAAIAAWLEVNEKCRHQTFEIDDGKAGGHDWPSVAGAAGARRVWTVPVPRLVLDAAAAGNWLISRLLGYAPMLTAGKVRELTQANWICDNGGFFAATGWQPAIDLEQGLKQMFAAE